MTRKKVERDEDFLASERFMTTSPQMCALIDSILRMQEGPTSRLMAQSMIFELLACQIEQISQLHYSSDATATIPKDELERLHTVRDYVDRHFLEELSLSGLSRVGALNEFKLKKGFKTVFGISVIQYARQLRMEYAQKLLRDHCLSIEEVSVKLGYQYPNHFSTAFRKHFGASHQQFDARQSR
jgi:AraC-like DNA-binding protein